MKFNISSTELLINKHPSDKTTPKQKTNQSQINQTNQPTTTTTNSKKWLFFLNSTFWTNPKCCNHPYFFFYHPPHQSIQQNLQNASRLCNQPHASSHHFFPALPCFSFFSFSPPSIHFAHSS